MLLLVIGVVIVIGSVAGGYLMHGGHLGVLNQPAEFIIIGGAAIGSLLIGTPMPVLKALAGQLKGMMRSGPVKEEYLELLAMLYQLFRVGQQGGMMALESHVEDPAKSEIFSRRPRFLARHEAVAFLSDSVKMMIVGGVSPHDLEALMDEDLEALHEEALKPSQTVAKVADALPGLGIVAAVLGVVVTMGAIDGPASEIGHKVGAALVGTFLGIVLSYGFAQPIATKLEHVVADDERYLVCLKTGLVALAKGLAPAVAVEFARRVLPNDVRPSFEQTEAACRAANSARAEQQAA